MSLIIYYFLSFILQNDVRTTHLFDDFSGFHHVAVANATLHARNEHAAQLSSELRIARVYVRRSTYVLPQATSSRRAHKRAPPTVWVF